MNYVKFAYLITIIYFCFTGCSSMQHYPEEGSQCVSYDGKYYLADSLGKRVSPEGYDDLTIIKKCALAERDGKYMLINLKGDILTPYPYDSFEYCFNHAAIVSREGKKGIINLEGKEVLPLIYDSISYITDQLVSAVTGDTFFLTDNHGRILTEKSSMEEIIEFAETSYENIIENEILFWDGILDKYEAL